MSQDRDCNGYERGMTSGRGQSRGRGRGRGAFFSAGGCNNRVQPNRAPAVGGFGGAIPSPALLHGETQPSRKTGSDANVSIVYHNYDVFALTAHRAPF